MNECALPFEAKFCERAADTAPWKVGCEYLRCISRTPDPNPMQLPKMLYKMKGPMKSAHSRCFPGCQRKSVSIRLMLSWSREESRVIVEAKVH